MLEARTISFSFGSTPLFTDFSLEVAAGERVALQAPSGFGKTTLCKLLAGFLPPDKGEIFVDGKPLPKKGVSPVQLILQHPETAVDPRLRMSETLKEAGAQHALQEELIERFGIKASWLSRYPHELSGGELQRFCIVRALAAQPRYVIADEISTMLDAVMQAKIWGALLDVAEERDLGMIIVTHSPALTARVATRAVELTNTAPRSNTVIKK